MKWHACGPAACNQGLARLGRAAKASGSYSCPDLAGGNCCAFRATWLVFCSINFHPRCWPFRGKRTSGIFTSKDQNLFHEGQAKNWRAQRGEERKPRSQVSALGQARRYDLGVTGELPIMGVKSEHPCRGRIVEKGQILKKGLNKETLKAPSGP